MRIFLFVFLLLLSTASLAKNGSECVLVIENSARLACFDKVFGITKNPEIKAKNGQWFTQSSQSKFDDSPEVSIMILSDNEVMSTYGSPLSVALLIACRENKTSLIVGFDTILSEKTMTAYRIDKLPPARIRMSADTTSKSVGLWGGRQSIPFIKKMFGKKRLLVRATSYFGRNLDAEFDIIGIESAIKPLAKACNWKP